MSRRYPLFSLLAGLVLGPALIAQQASSTPPGRTDLTLPTQAAPRPQTDAEAELGKKMGRPRPEMEVLRPVLDANLVDFKPSHDKNMHAVLTGASSDVTVLLIHRWMEAFKQYYPNIHIAVDPPYAGSLGAKELVAGKLDFVIVSRELKPDDVTDFQKKFKYDPLSVPVSGGTYRHYGFLDAIVFYVNRSNPIDSLTFAQLDAIFSKTHHRGGAAVATWGDLGVTGPQATHPIHLYGVQPWNGFEEFVRQRVLSKDGKRGEWSDAMRYDKVVFPIAGRVANDPDGIGYGGLAYVDRPVKLLALSVAGEAPVSPTYTDVVLATYPLSRVIYFNTNKSPERPLNPAIDEFLRFLLSKQGQEVVRGEGLFVPLRQSQVSTSLTAIGK